MSEVLRRSGWWNHGSWHRGHWIPRALHTCDHREGLRRKHLSDRQVGADLFGVKTGVPLWDFLARCLTCGQTDKASLAYAEDRRVLGGFSAYLGKISLSTLTPEMLGICNARREQSVPLHPDLVPVLKSIPLRGPQLWPCGRDDTLTNRHRSAL